jgi:hypothetical protein
MFAPQPGEEVGRGFDDRSCGILDGSVLQPIQKFGNFWPHGVELHMAKLVISDRRAASCVKVKGDPGPPPSHNFDRIDFDYRHPQTCPSVAYGLQMGKSGFDSLCGKSGGPGRTESHRSNRTREKT